MPQTETKVLCTLAIKVLVLQAPNKRRVLTSIVALSLLITSAVWLKKVLHTSLANNLLATSQLGFPVSSPCLIQTSTAKILIPDLRDNSSSRATAFAKVIDEILEWSSSPLELY